MKIRKKTWISLIIVVICTTLLPGCWDNRELEELFVAYTASIDISKEDPNLFSFSLSGPSVEEKAEDPSIKIASQGKSIQDAMINIQTKLYREVVLGHIQVLLIGEDTAKQGITVFLDSFDRNPDVRGTLLLGITKGRAGEFLVEAETKQNPYTGIFLKELLSGTQRESIAPSLNLREFYRDINIDGKDPCMPYLILSSTKDQISVNHVAVFQRDRFIGILDRDESIAAIILMNKIKEGRISISLPSTSVDDFHDSVSIDLYTSRRKITPVIEGEKVKFKIDIKVTGEMSEHTPTQRVIVGNALEQQDKLFEKKIKKDIEKALAKLQEYRSDIVGFGEIIRIKHPDFFNKDRWREDFAKAEFDIHVEFQIKRIGSAA